MSVGAQEAACGSWDRSPVPFSADQKGHLGTGATIALRGVPEPAAGFVPADAVQTDCLGDSDCPDCWDGSVADGADRCGDGSQREIAVPWHRLVRWLQPQP